MSEEDTGHWRKLYDKELHDLYASVNFGVTTLQGIKRVKHVTRNGETRRAYRRRNMEETDNLEELGVDGRVIFEVT